MAPPSAIDVSAATDTKALAFSDHSSVNDVAARRAKAPAISSAIAAYASSDMFKRLDDGKPSAKRWDHRLTEECTSRKPSVLKAVAQYLKTPGLISLGGGLPSSEYFPFEQLDIKIPTGPFFSDDVAKRSEIVQTVGKHDIAEGKSIYDMHVGLNYSQATGSPQMVRFVTEHTEIVHHPPYRDWQCALTIGNTSALYMAFRMFTTRGEYIMSEEYTYPAVVETGAPLGIKYAGIKMDEDGLLPSDMDSLLSSWDPKARLAPKPWLLYTVPTGQNPTGATQSEQRRRDIYRVAQKHDVYILEDDPYYFLQMQPYTTTTSTIAPPASQPSQEEYLQSLSPSFLSMDVDGRVMRMDSLSKVIAPGTRTGWITASAQIIERFVRHAETSTQNASGFSQLVLFKLLDETWGHAGYLNWLLHLRTEYAKRRDNICRACETFLPSEVASWKAPRAGMFHWIKISWRLHPSHSLSLPPQTPSTPNPNPNPQSLPPLPHPTIEESIFQSAIAHGVLICKGSWFLAEKENPSTSSTLTPVPIITIPSQNPSTTAISNGETTSLDDRFMFFRMTFAAAEQEQVQEAVRRFGGALREVFGLGEGGL